MSTKTEKKQRRTFTLSSRVLGWVEVKAKEYKMSRSELVNQLLDRHYQEERKQKMEEGYKALGKVLKRSARASLSLQKKVIPDY